jgi:hypothetical protein
MKRYSVKLVRRLDQSAVVSVDADNASDAAHKGIEMTPLFWRTDVTESTYYESVKEIVEPTPEPESKEKNITTKIYTYDVELDVSYDGGDLVSSCFVSKQRGRTKYCSSLALLDDQGTIEGDNWGDVIQVPDKVVKKIYAWAEENGY